MKMPATARLPEESEARFQARVMALARLNGWKVYHTHDSRRSEPGFPDLVMARNIMRAPMLIFAELKRERCKLGPEQREWIESLAWVANIAPVMAVYVWRPSEMDSIARVLSR